MVRYVIHTILIFYSLQVFAQRKVTFNNQIKENSIYKTTTLTNIKGNFQINADKAILDQMRTMGVESVMKMNQKTNTVLISTTYSRNKSGKIPAILYYPKMVSNLQMSATSVDTGNLLDGIKIYGTYATENQFKLDSIKGKKLTKQIHTLLTASLKQTQNHITFPKKPLGIGDSFKNNIPMSVPASPSAPMDINVIVVYTLKSILGKSAFFSVNQSISMNTNQEGLAIKASGKGQGVLEYDLVKESPKKYTSEMPIKMQISTPDDTKMNVEMNTKTSHYITISRRR